MALAVESYIRSLDAREIPRYNLSEAARYLGMTETRLRNWFTGYYYPTGSGERRWAEPILKPADASSQSLSFYDIASAHVVLGFRGKKISLKAVREAIRYYVTEIDPQRYPLLSEDFYTFGKDIIIEKLGQHISLTKPGQLAISRIVERYLDRIERDPHTKMPVRFAPLRSPSLRGHDVIVIDPNVSYGKPVIRGTRITAEFIARRNQSGESVSALVKDYKLSRRVIEEAISYCSQKKAA
jgi:uncharacterized protein (DUF433 family)